jgi:hypothetical protein
VKSRWERPEDVEMLRDVETRMSAPQEFRQRSPESFYPKGFFKRLAVSGKVRERILRTTGELRDLVTSFAGGNLGKGVFWARLTGYQNALSSLFGQGLSTRPAIEKKKPFSPDLMTEFQRRQNERPPLSKDIRPVYPLPTLAECEDKEKYRTYVESRRKFLASLQLMDVSVLKSLSAVELRLETDRLRRTKVVENRKFMDKLQVVLTDSLATAGPR